MHHSSPLTACAMLLPAAVASPVRSLQALTRPLLVLLLMEQLWMPLSRVAWHSTALDLSLDLWGQEEGRGA